MDMLFLRTIIRKCIMKIFEFAKGSTGWEGDAKHLFFFFRVPLVKFNIPVYPESYIHQGDQQIYSSRNKSSTCVGCGSESFSRPLCTVDGVCLQEVLRIG